MWNTLKSEGLPPLHVSFFSSNIKNHKKLDYICASVKVRSIFVVYSQCLTVKITTFTKTCLRVAVWNVYKQNAMTIFYFIHGLKQ